VPFPPPSQSNGFHGSKGISGLIPEGYTMLESEFEREVQRVGRGWTEPPSAPIAPPPLPAPTPTAVSSIPAEGGAPKGQGTSQSATAAAAAAEKRKIGHGVELTEWEREGWTYHAKGESLNAVLRARRIYCRPPFADSSGSLQASGSHPRPDSLLCSRSSARRTCRPDRRRSTTRRPSS
jgi:hypothetical protein